MRAWPRDPGAPGAAREPRTLTAPSEQVTELAEEVLGRAPSVWREVEGGQTHARGWVAETAEGPRFVKAAEEPSALRALRAEVVVFDAVRGSFLPRSYGSAFAGEAGILVLEDLSGARWPPPYPANAAPLFEALDALGDATPPPSLTPLEGWAPGGRWRRVAAEPEPLVALGCCSRDWLAAALPELIAAEERAELGGEQLVHNDVWSGNVCFVDDRAVLIDWATAARGNRWFDVALALVSVRAEGGTTPAIDVPNLAELMALLAGHHAVQATSSRPEWAREDSALLEGHLADLRVAVPWAAELLGLPPP